MIRNSCDHGLESPAERLEKGKSKTGELILKASHQGGSVHITITDDGRGVNVEKVSRLALEKGVVTEEELEKMSRDEKIMLITRPGFSTADQISDVSGRGVGMDVVKSTIEKLGGQLSIQSEDDKGSEILLELPLTLAIVPAVIIRQGDSRYAIPQTNVDELLCLYRDKGEFIESANLQETYRLRDELLPIVRLKETFEFSQPLSEVEKALIYQKYHGEAAESKEAETVVVLKASSQRYGLVVDEIISSEEIVVNALHSSLEALPCVSGATVMGDGRVSLILDSEGIAQFNNINYSVSKSSSKVELNDLEENTVSAFRFECNQHLLAVPVSSMKRIVRVKASDFQSVGHDCFVTVSDRSLAVLNPLKYLKLEEGDVSEELFLIIAKSESQDCGILADRILEIQSISEFLERDESEFLAGRFLLDEQLNLLLNLDNIVQSFTEKAAFVEAIKLADMEVE